MSEIKFAGQVALVTGASRGIGAAIAHELVVRGLTVIGTATSDEGAAKIGAVLSAVPGAAAGCRGARLDVNDAQAVEVLKTTAVQNGTVNVAIGVAVANPTAGQMTVMPDGRSRFDAKSDTPPSSMRRRITPADLHVQ